MAPGTEGMAPPRGQGPRSSTTPPSRSTPPGSYPPGSYPPPGSAGPPRPGRPPPRARPPGTSCAKSPRPLRCPRPHRLEAPPSRARGPRRRARPHPNNSPPSRSWGPSPRGAGPDSASVRQAAGKSEHGPDFRHVRGVRSVYVPPPPRAGAGHSVVRRRAEVSAGRCFSHGGGAVGRDRGARERLDFAIDRAETGWGGSGPEGSTAPRPRGDRLGCRGVLPRN